jgi:O-methyltransferase
VDIAFEKPRKSLVQLFAAYLRKVARMKNRAPSPFGTYYEFGTGWGRTMAAFMLAAERVAGELDLGPTDFRVVAFDSFEGMPPTDHPADKHPGWKPGAMGNSIEIIQNKMETHPFAKLVEVTYVKGFFENSLTEKLMNELKSLPPSIVTIDVDFYTSTRDVLFWIDQFIASGAMLYFDDMWAFHGHPEYGQIRAIHEFCAAGRGSLVHFDTAGEAGKTFVYARKQFEY